MHPKQMRGCGGGVRGLCGVTPLVISDSWYRTFRFSSGRHETLCFVLPPPLKRALNLLHKSIVAPTPPSLPPSARHRAKILTLIKLPSFRVPYSKIGHGKTQVNLIKVVSTTSPPCSISYLVAIRPMHPHVLKLPSSSSMVADFGDSQRKRNTRNILAISDGAPWLPAFRRGQQMCKWHR